MIGKQSSGSKDKGPWMLRPLQAKQTLWKDIDKEKQLKSGTVHFNNSFSSNSSKCIGTYYLDII